MIIFACSSLGVFSIIFRIIILRRKIPLIPKSQRYSSAKLPFMHKRFKSCIRFSRRNLFNPNILLLLQIFRKHASKLIHIILRQQSCIKRQLVILSPLHRPFTMTMLPSFRAMVFFSPHGPLVRKFRRSRISTSCHLEHKDNRLHDHQRKDHSQSIMMGNVLSPCSYIWNV